MHETFLLDVKFYLDIFERHENTYFLAGWVHSDKRTIESLRVDAGNGISHEQTALEVRRDVNAFYQLPINATTGFKFILSSEQSLPELIFSIKYQNEDTFKVIKSVPNPSSSTSPTSKLAKPEITVRNQFPGMVVIEDFYDDPDKVRAYALQQDFQHDANYHKGARTQSKTIFPGTKECFERILGKKITNWESHIYNGVFQYCVAQDPLVYHTDNQSYAAVIFLTPDAPAECGTSFFKSRYNGLSREPTEADCERLGKSKSALVEEMFAGNFYDRTRWELVDVIGNVYNRMAMWDARKVHAASQYFGNTPENSRLFHMFFFDAE